MVKSVEFGALLSGLESCILLALDLGPVTNVLTRKMGTGLMV